ncbi:MAG: hypothetical protein ABFR82_09590 [Nitrospirota bacterium]
MKKIMENEGFIKGVVYLIIIGLAAIIAISFTMPYYRYYVLKLQSEGYMKIENNSTKVVREKIMETAKELKVPLIEDNLKISRIEDTLFLKAHWTEIVYIFGKYQKELYFSLDLEY